MKRALFGCQFTGIVAVSALFAQSAAAQSQTPQSSSYTVTDLGLASEATPAQPLFIANNGLIADAVAAGSVWHAVLWFQGMQLDLTKAGGLGGPNSTAFGVNEKGQAVGFGETADFDPAQEDFCTFGTSRVCQAFVWQNGVMSALPPLKDAFNIAGRNTIANAINNLGQVVGTAENTTLDSTCPPYDPSSLQYQKYQFKPVMWANGKIQELPTPSGDPDGFVLGINERGQAVGATGTCAGLQLDGAYLHGHHATLWQNGSVIDLGNLGGVAPGFGNWAYKINKWGHVVGTSGTRDGSFHAFFWSPETLIQDLGTLPGDAASAGFAINEIGDVTGISLSASGQPRAFIRPDGGTMTDLNALVPANTTNLYLFTACSINSRGEIIGMAF
ncbi:MAG: hypothetical protein JO336_00385, partial [Acidobacteriia bacterium]|nr:hypothetical protein [Terriglobia bacterium]